MLRMELLTAPWKTSGKVHNWPILIPLSRDSRGLWEQMGERGVKLSGGQRQRIAIARAMLAIQLLRLDEATSHLDASNEEKVQAAMEKLMVGRTTLVIAHRLGTIRNADRILVIHEGGVAESGTMTN